MFVFRIIGHLIGNEWITCGGEPVFSRKGHMREIQKTVTGIREDLVDKE
jgi:hypothetical protein